MIGAPVRPRCDPAPNASPDQVSQTVRRWKHLAAITQEGQELILTRSSVDRARRQIGLFTSLLLVVSAVNLGMFLQVAELRPGPRRDRVEALRSPLQVDHTDAWIKVKVEGWIEGNRQMFY